MEDEKKTKEKLIKELRSLHKRVSKLGASRAGQNKTAQESKRSYAELRPTPDESFHSDKLAFTGRIAANIAHEIRNPLTNVAMSAEQLNEATDSDDPRAKDIGIIRRNVERADYLITELLNCARPPKLNMQRTDGNKVLKKVLKNTLESAKTKIRSQKIQVVRKFTSKICIVRMNREQMGRALSNLISNAIEAMPRRGKLTIITALDQDLFTLKIQDTGKGIPEKDIISIYDPFFSTKPDGVGLGLTLCYGIIVSHGGIIGVESKPRKGTIFTVSLPAGRHY